MREFSSTTGEQLYNLLPAVYREQDNNVFDQQNMLEQLGDLAMYLDSCGILLDELHNTLEQRLADSFPDNPQSGLACQDWLIPYFARLLDVGLVSPHVRGQRDEVAKAISWRQRKGTQNCVEEIGESITQQELEIQEGWQRVAVTARIGMPLLPLAVYGIDGTLNTSEPMQVYRHPGAQASTVDFRCFSRAVQTAVASPASKISRFDGVPLQWMQANPRGVPIMPDTFDDVSQRTVDFRTPDWRDGHIHPRRVIASKPVPMGLFPRATHVLDWNDIRVSPYIVFSYDQLEEHVHIRNHSDVPVTIEGDIVLAFIDLDVSIITIEGINFDGSLTLNDGKLRLQSVVVSHVIVNTEYALLDEPALEARDSLFGDLSVTLGSVFVDSCTIMQASTCAALVCENSIIMDSFLNNDGVPPLNGRIRYSRMTTALLAYEIPDDSYLVIESESCTDLVPVFFESSYALDNNLPVTPDSAVLTPNCAEEICYGAEDGGELGVYHNGRFSNAVVIQLDQQINLQQLHQYSLQGLVFESTLTIEAASSSPLYLDDVAIHRLDVQTTSILDEQGNPLPVLYAMNSLFEELAITNGYAQFEYCTVINQIEYQNLRASDCIFNGVMLGSGEGGLPTNEDCIRFSRIPDAFIALSELRFPSCTSERAILFHSDFSQALAGVAGMAVLHPATPNSIAFGAEDGGEMGAYHARRYTLQDEAVLDKLRNYLPVGIKAVLRPDRNLNQTPYRPGS